MATEGNLVLRGMLHRLGTSGDERSDGELLDAFRVHGSESAFAALVERHGAMVLGVCRRLLGKEEDAEDAFQATFFVLARRAAALDGKRSLAGWLHTVAHNVSVKALLAASRRQRRERAVGVSAVSMPAPAAEGQEVRDVVDAELTRLPEKYRAPLVLCYFEGKTHDEAARALGWPRGSMSTRLARGQELLRQRLVRRGLTLTTATAWLTSISEGRAAVPPGLVSFTTRGALAFAAGNSDVAAPAAELAGGVLKNMYARKMKFVCLSALLIGALALGAGVFLHHADAQETGETQARTPRDPSKPFASLEVLKKTVDGENQFAFDLYKQLRGKKGNLFFSPYSISTALAMTSAGARNQTDAEMVKTLHLLPKPADRHAGFGELIRLTQRDAKKNKGVQLNVANALWGQQGFDFLKSYEDTTEEYYNAGLRRLDFGKSEAARQEINGWVAQQTNDRIKDLIPRGVLDAYTRLVLTNAIYFKGDWESQFKKDHTRELPFFVDAKTTVKTPLMYQKGEYKLYADASLQAIELPYVGKNLSMVVLLPKAKDGLDAVEKGLDADKLNTILGKMYKVKLDLYLPRFQTRSRFMLHKTLGEMGMPSAFDNSKADFSGVTGQRGLFISHVIHEGFVAVNEEGSEAAAATAVVQKLVRAVAQPPTFRADHPFTYLIRDNTTGSILFLGRFVAPTK